MTEFLHPSVAARVVNGARYGRLILTPNEAEIVFEHLVESPRSAVVLRHAPGDVEVVEIRDLALTILDVDETPDLNFLTELDPDDEWTKAHLASYLEGLLNADDLERLLP